MTAEQVDDVLVGAGSATLRPSSYRLAWRRMIAPDTERALYAALVPPGRCTRRQRFTASPCRRSLAPTLMAGFWASLPLDYLLRATGRGHLRDAGAEPCLPRTPTTLSPPALLLRALRLNCLTSAYADLWAELYDPAWPPTNPGRGLARPPAAHDVAPTGDRDTPLRTERARRSALVEIDALVAVWLGMDADALIATYRAGFPCMQKYEAVTWFDAEGWKIAGERSYTIGQRPDQGPLDAVRGLPTQRPTGHRGPPSPTATPPPSTRPTGRRRCARRTPYFKARLDAAVAAGSGTRRSRRCRSREADAGGTGLKESLLQYLSTTYAPRPTRAPARRCTGSSGTRRPGMFRGPYLRIRTPFTMADDGWREHLDWRARRAGRRTRTRPRAFARLTSAGGHTPQPTLVTTGTGSGKTEAFLYPVARPLRAASGRRGRPGSRRCSCLPDERPRHRPGAAHQRAAHASNAELPASARRPVHRRPGGHAVRAGATTRSDMQLSPPDILITNYKMLDLLLQRADDAPLWAAATSATSSSTSSTPTTARRAPTSRCCCAGLPPRSARPSRAGRSARSAPSRPRRPSRPDGADGVAPPSRRGDRGLRHRVHRGRDHRRGPADASRSSCLARRCDPMLPAAHPRELAALPDPASGAEALADLAEAVTGSRDLDPFAARCRT